MRKIKNFYRIHKKYKKEAENYGVIQTGHYISWTRQMILMIFIGFIKIITAKTTTELFAIDLPGFNDYIRKYYYLDDFIGSPAILKEEQQLILLHFRI